MNVNKDATHTRAARDDDQSAIPPVDRRSILAFSVGVAATVFLGACGSSPSRRGSLGDPIPSSPDYRPIARGTREQVPIRRPLYNPPRGNLPQQITVLNRQTWATRGPVLDRANRMGKIRSVTIHHDGMTPFTSMLYDDTARRLESIRNSHVNNGWADIGYHYAIDPAGRVWECRPESVQGAHVKDYNPGNLGILVLGNYEQQRPTAATTHTLDNLIAAKLEQHRVALNSVYTHREWARTACPGRHLQAHMQTARASGGPIDRANVTIAMA